MTQPDFTFSINDDGFYAYKIKEKIKNRVCELTFYEDYHYGDYYYSLFLNINIKNKRKNESYLRQDGYGLTFLLWAKNKIIEFEKYILKIRGDAKKINIYLNWDDNRRRDVYYYGLSKIGYEYKYCNNKKCLMKRIL